MRIIYYAADETMGETAPEQCEQYRQWALGMLIGMYHDYQVSVLDTPSLVTAWTDDEDNRDDILDACARLWDACPWTWG